MKIVKAGKVLTSEAVNAELILNDQARDASEAVRASNEVGRGSNEAERIASENARIAAEIAREAAEGDRDTAETERLAAESARALAETARATVYAEVETARGGQASLDTRLDGVDAQLAQKASLAELNEKTSFGVISGLGVTQQSVPDMSVRVAAGVIWMANGTRFAPIANNALAVTAADATNPRIDIVYINSSGVIAYLAGTAAATPAQPATPAGGQLIATISVAATVTSIVTASIADRRKNLWTEAWITPTLENGATGTVQYRLNTMGRVEFKGTLTAPNQARAFLPIYLPPANIAAAFPYTDNSGLRYVLIQNGAAGFYTYASTAKTIDLAGFSYAI